MLKQLFQVKRDVYYEQNRIEHNKTDMLAKYLL